MAGNGLRLNAALFDVLLFDAWGYLTFYREKAEELFEDSTQKSRPESSNSLASNNKMSNFFNSFLPLQIFIRPLNLNEFLFGDFYLF